MRRGPTALAPSPLAGEGGGEGKKGPLSPLCPIPRGVMPVLPVPTRSEILHFEALRGSGEPQGRHFVQNDNGEVRMTISGFNTKRQNREERGKGGLRFLHILRGAFQIFRRHRPSTFPFVHEGSDRFGLLPPMNLRFNAVRHFSLSGCFFFFLSDFLNDRCQCVADRSPNAFSNNRLHFSLDTWHCTFSLSSPS